MKYSEILPPTAMMREQAYSFVQDWLRQIAIESRKGKRAKRGMPYRRVLRQWCFMYGEDDVADIVRGARKVMDEIIKQKPALKQYL